MPTITLANLALVAIQFLLIAFISRHFGAEALARYSLAVAVFAPPLMFLASGQRNELLGTRPAADSAEPVFHKEGLAWRGGVILGALTIAEISSAVALRLSSDQLIVLRLVAALRVLDGYCELVFLIAIARKDQGQLLRVTAARILPLPLAIVIAIVANASLVVFLSIYGVIMLVAASATHLTITLPNRYMARSSISTTSMRRSLVSLSPSGANAAIDSCALIIPRFILAAEGTLQSVAAYTIFTQLVGAGGIVATSRLISDMADRRRDPASYADQRFRRMRHAVAETAAVMVALGLAVAFAPATVMGKVFGVWFVDYQAAAWIIASIGTAGLCAGYATNMHLAGGRDYAALRVTFWLAIVFFLGLALAASIGPVGLLWVAVWLTSFQLARFSLIVARH